MTVLLVGVQLGPCLKYEQELRKRGQYRVIIHTDLSALPKHVIAEVEVCVAIAGENDIDAQAALQSWMKQYVFSKGIVITWATYKQ